MRAAPITSALSKVRRSQPSHAVLLLLLMMGLIGTACGVEDPPLTRERPAAVEEVEVTAEERARLQALGYADTSSTPADERLSGVVVSDAGAVQPGYRLYSGASACEANLIDIHGNSIRRWRGEVCMNWSHVQLLPNGDMLAVVVPRPTPGKRRNTYLLRKSWTDELVWKLLIDPHHDAAPRPDGSLVALTRRTLRDPEIFTGGVVVDNPIVEVTTDGRPGRTLSVLASLKAWQGSCRLRDAVEAPPGVVDLFHTNSIKWIHRADLADGDSAFARPLVLLSMRHQDCVYLVDWESGRIVWDWGRGQLDGPHDATLLDNGNLLVFDNGLVRGWSRVLEVELSSGNIVWEYPGEAGEEFSSAGRGSSQRLPNGNTLIAESGKGRAFEVLPSGKIVWEFHNPRFLNDRRETIVRLIHYDASFIEPLLSDDPTN